MPLTKSNETGSAIIVTGSDSRYFALLQGLIRSIRDRPPGRSIALGVLDCGLADEERAWCDKHGAALVTPGDDVAFGAGLVVAPSFRAMTARPYLRRYFPGFDTYLWLDADVWVQEWAAVELYLAAARLGDIALVPEVHRSYSNVRDTRADFEAANGRAYAEAFGWETARRLIRYPLNNAGAFAIRHDSRAWEIWATTMAEAAQRSANMIDQIALNVAIYERGLSEARLPATCNWIAHLATPAWDAVRKLLVEPDPPFAPIGILHMTLATKWDAARPLEVIGGGAVSRTLRYEP